MAIDKGKRLMEVLGVGQGGGQLAKLRVQYENPPQGKGEVKVLFNPNELSFSQAISWQERETAAHSPAISGRSHDFQSAASETLSLQLFFDSYEKHSNQLTKQQLTNLLPTLPFFSSDASDVRNYTKQIVALGAVNKELHRPPICELFWGTDKLFQGVLTQLDQTYNMFLPSGIPVRASLNCTFTAYEEESLARGFELHSADVAKSRILQRGETLHAIAAEEYNDPSLWRHIARANNIINPRRVPPGTKLFIPSLPL